MEDIVLNQLSGNGNGGKLNSSIINEIKSIGPENQLDGVCKKEKEISTMIPKIVKKEIF